MPSKTANQTDWLSQSPEEFKAQFEQQLQGDYKLPKPAKLKKQKRIFRSLFGWILLIGGVATIPFITLIRSSLIIHQNYELNGWFSLAGAATITIIVFSIGLFVLFRKVKNKRKLLSWTSKGASTLVIGFCMYALLFISDQNTKNEAVREVYRSLHPIMRVTISIVTLADSDLIITDISRTPEDYQRMGLTPLQSSMHYEQEDGFVYAIDLRTIGQTEIRNRLLKFSFDILGFKTLRHVGTADHLHISLPYVN